MLAFQVDHQDSIQVHGLQFEPLYIHTSGAQTDLRLELNQSESGISGIVEYSTDLFDAAMIDRLSRTLWFLLEQS